MNQKRIIYTSFQPYTLELAKQLHQDLGWDPVFWNVTEDFEQQVKAIFPEALTHDIMAAIKGKLPQGFDENDLEPLDTALLTDLSFHESIALNMMNRDYLIEPLTYQERLRLYHRQLRFYLALFKRLKPDYIILEDAPHQPCNYILYALAQKMGVKTILCECTWFANYFFPMERFEEGNLRFRNAYEKALNEYDGRTVALSDYMESAIQKIKGTHEKGMQNYMVHQVEKFSKDNNNNVFNTIKNYLLIFIKLFNILKFKNRFNYIINLRKPYIHSYYKEKGKKMELSAISNFDYLRAVRKIKKIKSSNLKYYRKIQNNTLNFDQPFIFCALHFQPEKSSSPWGGHFVNQLLVIDMLSKAIPEGWKIYVKDHITQYLYPTLGEPSRDQAFYDDILKLHNVEFIPLEYKSFDLIDKARAVASVAGSVLQESVVRGKPALAFGAGHYSWCGGCEGIFYTPDNDSLRNALNKIKSGYNVDFQKVKLYFHLIEKYAYNGYVGGSFQAKNSGITPEENGKIHAQAIKDFISDAGIANNHHLNQAI